MIELRWVERDVQNLHPATNIYGGRPRETVLQYRTWTDTSARTPWMDVPTEVIPTRPVSNIQYTDGGPHMLDTFLRGDG